MATLPVLTEKDLRLIFDGTYFQRAKQYYRAGAISDTAIIGQQLVGKSAGSYRSSYRIEVWLSSTGIERTACTCPIGGNCKHVIALLLTWVHQPQHFVPRLPVAERLKGLKKAQLVELVQAMLRRAPELEDLLDIPLPGSSSAGKQQVSAAAIKRQVARALALQTDDWHATGPVVNALEQIVEMANRYTLAHEWTNAQLVYTTLINRVLDGDEYHHDHDGDIIFLVGNVAQDLLSCLPQLAAQQAAKTATVRTLFRVIATDIELGGYGFSDGLADALFAQLDATDAVWCREEMLTRIRATDREDFSKWTLSQWGRCLLRLDKATGETARFRREAPQLGLYQPLFAHLLDGGLVEEAVQLAQTQLRDSDYEFLEAARRLESAGYTPQAVAMVLPYVDTITDHRLLEWLQEHTRTNPELQRRLLLRQWQQRPSLDLYQALQAQLPSQEEWDSLRTSLWASLTDRHLSLQIRILLHEAEVPLAWKLLRSGKAYVSTELWDEVVDAALPYFPEDAIDYYLEQVEKLITQRGRDNYRVAAAYLQKVKAHYLSHGQEADWVATISAIQEAHRRLPALREELSVL